MALDLPHAMHYAQVTYCSRTARLSVDGQEINVGVLSLFYALLELMILI